MLVALAAGAATAAGPEAPPDGSPGALEQHYERNAEGNVLAAWTVRRTDEGEIVRHGRFVRYHPDGRPAVVGAYRDGAPVGVWRWYDARGNLLRSALQQGDYEEVLRGRELSEDETVFRTPQGVKLAEGLFKSEEPHGLWHYYYPDGTPKAEGRYLVGIPDGRWTYYYRNGQIARITEYRLGVVHGLLLEGYDNGQERVQGHMDQGLREGTWRRWYRNGQRAEQGDYAADRREGEWRFWAEDGTLLKVLRYRGGKVVAELPLSRARSREPVIPDPDALPQPGPRIYTEDGRLIDPQPGY